MKCTPFLKLTVMDWNPIAAVGSGIIGAVSGAIQNNANRHFEAEQSALQRDWNERMMDKQNAWNLEQWSREIEYNSPAAQVQRMRDAGLNPLYYGLDGNGVTSAPSSAQALGYERASLPNQVNPFAMGLDAAAKVAQISNIQANTAKTNNENLTETQRRENMLTENLKLSQELKNLAAQQGLTEAQTKQVNKALEWVDRMNEAILSEKQASAALNESQKKRIYTLLEGEKILQSKTMQDFEERWKKISAEIKLMSQQTKLSQQDIENYALNHMQNGFMGTGLSFPNFIRALKEGLSNRGPSQDKPVESPEGVNTGGENLYFSHGLPIQ